MLGLQVVESYAQRILQGVSEGRFAHLRRFVLTPYKMMRSNGLLFPLIFGLKTIRHKWLTLRVRRLYFRGRREHPANRTSHEELHFRKNIVARGTDILSAVKAHYAARYSHREDLRFLFNMPPRGAAYYYFIDLAQCLRHTGLSIHLFTSRAEALDRALLDFRPSVFLTCDSFWGVGVSEHDVEALERYKERYGLARLYLPFYISPLRVTKPTPAILERIALHRNGRLADAFVGYFEDLFWGTFCSAWRDSGRAYYSIPFAANPFRHFPALTAQERDWAIATVNGDLGTRAELTLRYMSRVMRLYAGAIAGDNWGKGIEAVPPDEIAQFFCSTKISPNIAAESNVRYALDCGAKVHELSAMGVFQLASETTALRRYYPHTEVVGVHGPEEFNALFDYFVNKPDVRQAFVMKSMARTFSEHTYFQRIDRLVNILDSKGELF